MLPGGISRAGGRSCALNLATARLRLSHPDLGDALPYVTIWNDPAVLRYLRPIHTFGLPDALATIDAWQRHWEERGYGVWTLTDLATGEFAGYCGLRYLDELGKVEVLYGLLPAYWGRGLATEAALAARDFAFDTASLNELVGVVHPQNQASARVLENLGMTRQPAE